MRLRHHTQYLTFRHDNGGIVEAVPVTYRHSHKGNDRQSFRFLQEFCEC